MPDTRLLAGLIIAAALAGGVAAADPNTKSQVYKWTDENGIVHYGDAVPPQYAGQDQTLLNAQGVAVGSVPGRRTPEQQAVESARQASEQKTRQVALASQQRDQNLLATYLTVEEIEALRDRRADLIDGQARVTSTFLEQLRTRQRQLEQQVQRFRPYNPAPNAAQLPEPIAEDLVRTTTDIAAQQRNLESKKLELEKLKAQFASDIERFRELKRGSPN